MQLDLFGGVQRGSVGLDELFAAYLECRRNKRRTTNALAFEVDFEQKLIELWKDVNNGTYMPGRSIAFIVTEPVQREVFAADFRDRIIHHLIIGKIPHHPDKLIGKEIIITIKPLAKAECSNPT